MLYMPRFADHAADNNPALDTSEGSWTLEDVTDACATLHVSATLHDETGALRGRVDANGDYRLES